jgi:hypothetical protein
MQDDINLGLRSLKARDVIARGHPALLLPPRHLVCHLTLRLRMDVRKDRERTQGELYCQDSSFPLEVWGIIMDNFVDMDHTLKVDVDYAPLLALALVSRAIGGLATPRLYARVDSSVSSTLRQRPELAVFVMWMHIPNSIAVGREEDETATIHEVSSETKFSMFLSLMICW